MRNKTMSAVRSFTPQANCGSAHLALLAIPAALQNLCSAWFNMQIFFISIFRCYKNKRILGPKVVRHAVQHKQAIISSLSILHLLATQSGQP